MKVVRCISRGFLMAVLLVMGLFFLSMPVYWHEISELKKNYEGITKTMDSPFGGIEYIDEGDGQPILVSHGTMGGSDNGLLLARAYMGDQYRLIVPSRFGYLQSDLPSDASFEAQADCYAYLLDQLGVEKVIVQGMSAGGVPAVQFAIRHPEKTSGLLLVSSITYAPKEEVESQKLPVSEKLYEMVLKSDYLFWLFMKISPESVHSMFGATAEIKNQSTESELILLDDVSKTFLPVSKRFAGWKNDAKEIESLTDMPFEQIQVQTLVISSKDDTLAPSSWSEYMSSRIQPSQCVVFDSGGHMLLGHTEDVQAICQDFIGKSGESMERK